MQENHHHHHHHHFSCGTYIILITHIMCSSRGNQAAEKEIFSVPRGVLARLRQVSAECRLSVPEIALRWELSRPGVACVLVGASSPKQAKRNARLCKKLPEHVTKQVSTLSENLKLILGSTVDQYARESRVH